MLRDEILMDDEPIIYKGGRLEISDFDSHSAEKNNSLVPWDGTNYKSFFSGRNGLLEQAIDEIKQFFVIQEDELIGVWLLTEITFWDNEKERIVFVTKRELIVVKYDFIALKLLNHYKVQLNDIDTVVIGDLVYPSNSLAPHLIGFTTGVMRVLKNSVHKIANSRIMPDSSCSAAVFDVSYFKPRSRNMVGVRLMWNKGEPPKFVSKWNPFSNTIPWSTFVSHPLLWHKDSCEDEQKIYDVEYFASRVVKATHQSDRTSICNISQQSILLQNYFGVLSILHNRSSLGFFKVRGKLSF